MTVSETPEVIRTKIKKTWVPYEGPQGGTGWQNANDTDEIIYQPEPPGNLEVENLDSDQIETLDEYLEEIGLNLEDHVDPDDLPDDWDYDGDGRDSMDEGAPATAWNPGGSDEPEDDGDEQEEQADEPEGEDEELTWDNARPGDEITFVDDYGDVQTGEIVEDAREGFDVFWVDDGEGGEVPVEEDDFVGSAEDGAYGTKVDAPDTVDREWMDENLAVGQMVQFTDNETGETKFGEIQRVMGSARGTDAVEIKEQDGFGTVTITQDDVDWGVKEDDADIEAIQPWEDLSEDEQKRSMRDMFSQGVSYYSTPRDTQQRLDSFFRQDALDSFEESRVGREVMSSFHRIDDKVSRASCGGSGSIRMEFSENPDESTMHHEMGHGVMIAYGYDYEVFSGQNAEYSDEEWKRRPTNVSHEWKDLRKSRLDDWIPWDFSEDSDFMDPESYMFRSDDSDGAVGFDEFKEYTDAEIGADLEHDDLLDREYESVGDEVADDVLSRIDEGDMVVIDVPNREPTEQRLILNQHGDGHATFEKPNGDTWDWGIEDDGSLRSSVGSELIGVDDTRSEESGLDEDPLNTREKYDWLKDEPENHEEKIENFVTASNRAWYKQAKTVDSDFSNPFEIMNKSIGNGYSTTNCQETVAKTHEVIQSERTVEVVSIAEHHPDLLVAYIDLFSMPDYVWEVLEDEGYADPETDTRSIKDLQL